MTSLEIIPPIIAHRGASAYAPENTLIAFTMAMQMGVTWIEFDLMQSACGMPIIFHDDELTRTAGITSNIRESPYTYLQTLDVGKWFDPFYSGEKIPTLQQTLEFLQTANMHANLEIKAWPGTEESLIKQALPLLSAYLAEDNNKLLFSSFSVPALQVLAQYLPHARKGLLVHDWDADLLKTAQDLNCVSIHVFEEVLTYTNFKQIKEIDMAVLSYTVNEMERAQELFKWGVDAIFTDVPDKAITWWRTV